MISRVKIEWDDMNSDSCAVDQYRLADKPVGINQWFQKYWFANW